MIVALILAGGLARRMGGGDKGLQTLAGRPILSHVLDRLAPQVDRIIINANGDPARFAPFALPVIPDDLPDHPGPLAGILAGLDWTATHQPGAEWLVSVPADSPFLPTDLVRRLISGRGTSEIACAASGGHVHPVIALWPISIRHPLRAYLLAGHRKVGHFTESAAQIEWPTTPHDPFFNINTPSDLTDATRLSHHPSPPETPSPAGGRGQG